MQNVLVILGVTTIENPVNPAPVGGIRYVPSNTNIEI